MPSAASAQLLADRRIATEGRVAVAVGPGQGDSIAAELEIDAAEIFRVTDGTHDSAVALGKRLRAGAYEAVAGIGGGRTIDVTKFAAHMAGHPAWSPSPPTSRTTASPRRSAPWSTSQATARTASCLPVAVVVDLDRVRCAPDPLASAGIGDVVSNLSAVSDWELAAADTGELVDGLAAAMARSAAHAVVHQPGPARSDEFLTVLAEALVLSGLAMAVAGSSRPCQRRRSRDHACGRPAVPGHRQPRRAGRRRRAVLRVPAGGPGAGGDDLRLPGPARPAATPADLGLSLAEFAKAVALAPATRPGRYTILERLAMSEAETAKRVEEYARAYAG